MDVYAMVVGFFQEGGVFMYPIALVMGVGVAIALERFAYLVKETHANRRDYDAILPLLRQKRLREVAELAKRSKSAVCRIVADGVARIVITSYSIHYTKLYEQMESIKRSLVELKRDLVVLEEDLLFPASTQLAVYLSMDVGEFFALDAVTLKLNGKDVSHHLYTEKQTDALYRGGVQRLYVGNVKQGANRLTAFFTGRGPQGRDYRRAATVEFEKTFEPTYVELKITDSTAKYQLV